VTALQPGFVDASRSEAEVSPNRPQLLTADKEAKRGPIDHHWEPAKFGTRKSRWSSSVLITTGIALLIAGWLVLAAIGFLADQFHRAVSLGAFTLVVFGIASMLIAVGALIEARSYRALIKVEALRDALSRAAVATTKVKATLQPWSHAVTGQLPDGDVALAALQDAATIGEIKAVLRDRILPQLREMADQAGVRAAVEGGAVVAITPSSILDGVLAGLRALALIRRIARIYGLRPGPVVTIALLRRVAWTVTAVSGVEMASRSLTELTLERVPLISHLAAAVPGTAVTALRLYRLAGVTAEACSPLVE
jgi:putative membrane protein